MYHLTRLSLKNWYLCEAVDVEFRRSIGILGPTGSGKSSLLDAIQAVICGGSTRRMHLNASADAHGDRKLIDYCLGYISPKKDGGEPLRESCETILALTFSEERADGSQHHVSVGIVMNAHIGDTREHLVSRFIVPGLSTTVEDWKEQTLEGTEIKSWAEILAELKRGGCNVKEYRASAERFVQDMLATMRPVGRQPDPKQFLNAFGNAVLFRPINNPTQFMRDYILERNDLDIGRVREKQSRWRDVVKTAQEIEDKVAVLAGVRKSFESWGRAVLERARLDMTLACAKVEHRRRVYGEKSRKWYKAIEEATKAEQIYQGLAGRLGAFEEELDTKRALLASRGIDGRLQIIVGERKMLARDAQDLEGKIRNVRQALQLAANLTVVKDYMATTYVAIVAGAEAALKIVDAKPGLDWLKTSTADVAQHLGKLKGLRGLQVALEQVLDGKDGKREQMVEARRRRDDAEENIRRSGKGGAALQRHTQELIRLLQRAGIEATALCDVVEVNDSEWQFSVESLLGPQREALIVDPSRVREAHSILYQHRNEHDLHRCRLVKTTRTAGMEIRIHPGSIASVVQSDNQHAMAYLVTHLGNCQMAESPADLERHSRAIMKNGQATQAMDLTVHRDRGVTLILGRTARERSAEMAREQYEAARAELETLQRDISRLDAAKNVAENLAKAEFDLDAIAFQYEEIERKTRDLEGQKTAAMSEEDRVLAEEIEDLVADIKERRAEIEEARQSHLALAKAASALEQQRGSARDALREAVATRRRAIRDGWDQEVMELAKYATLASGDKYRGPINPYFGQKLVYEQKPVNEAIAFFAVEELRLSEVARAPQMQREKIVRLGAMARERMMEEYCRRYMVEPLHREDAALYLSFAWVIIQHNTLEQNELRLYKEQAQKAERDLLDAVKEDLLSRLIDKFGSLDVQLRALNSHLRKYRFTGQIYKFGKKPDPAFEKIRRLAVAVGSKPEEAQAIIEKRVDDPELREAMADLERFIETPDAEDHLEDYRRYFSFDLFMVPEDQADEDLEKARGRMSLSARAGVASGGEAQAPFYIAMAASMAMAYFPGGHTGQTKSGMGLVLFDEAFNKLDVQNTQELIRFFAELGLQLLVAAPDHERPTFTEVFDTIVTVSKSAATSTVYIASDFPKERARRELAAINPNRKGVEGFRAELAAQATAQAQASQAQAAPPQAADAAAAA